MDDETNWQRQLLVGLTVLVAVGALIGGIVALISITAADYAGIDGSDSPTSPTTLSQPSDDAPSDDDPSEPTESGGTSVEPTPSESTKKPRPDKGITLVATPTSVSSYDRINLTGTYAGGSGTTLQVQRKEGGQWVDFPTSATVNGRTFATYVETGRPGTNKFRMKVIGASQASNPVTVRVS